MKQQIVLNQDDINQALVTYLASRGYSGNASIYLTVDLNEPRERALTATVEFDNDIRTTDENDRG